MEGCKASGVTSLICLCSRRPGRCILRTKNGGAAQAGRNCEIAEASCCSCPSTAPIRTGAPPGHHPSASASALRGRVVTGVRYSAATGRGAASAANPASRCSHLRATLGLSSCTGGGKARLRGNLADIDMHEQHRLYIFSDLAFHRTPRSITRSASLCARRLGASWGDDHCSALSRWHV